MASRSGGATSCRAPIACAAGSRTSGSLSPNGYSISKTALILRPAPPSGVFTVGRAVPANRFPRSSPSTRLGGDASPHRLILSLLPLSFFRVLLEAAPSKSAASFSGGEASCRAVSRSCRIRKGGRPRPPRCVGTRALQKETAHGTIRRNMHFAVSTFIVTLNPNGPPCAPIGVTVIANPDVIDQSPASPVHLNIEATPSLPPRCFPDEQNWTVLSLTPFPQRKSLQQSSTFARPATPQKRPRRKMSHRDGDTEKTSCGENFEQYFPLFSTMLESDEF